MIRVYNPTLDLIGLLEEYESFQFSVKYRDAGSFKIKAILTDKSLSLLQVGNFISYDNFGGYITGYELSQEQNNTPMIVATGYDLTGLLSTRIIWNNFYFTGRSEVFLRKCVTDNAISPTNTNRVIPYLSLDTLNNLTHNTDRNTANETLLAECKKVCNVKGADYGFTIKGDFVNKTFKFSVFQGTDYSSQVIISEDFDNVISKDYIQSKSSEVNCVFVANNDYTTTSSVEGTQTGFNRKEAFVKAGIMQEEGQSAAEYVLALQSEAKKAITDTVECFDVDIYGINLSIGDKVSVKDKNWNISTTRRITEIKNTIDKGDYTITYILGDDVITQES